MRNYSVVVLGTRGAGKTVFLASLFHRLSTAGRYGFFLEAPGDQRKQLNSIYKTVAVDDEWPEANQLADFRKFEFRCRVISPRAKSYDAFTMTYWDYAGGLLTADGTDGTEAFEAVLADADSFLALLDGQRVYDYVEGLDPTGSFVFEDIPGLVPILSGSDTPLQLVITKWDVFGPEYSLERVRKKLLEIDQLRDLIAAKKFAGLAVRLIPVSSVGYGFARQDGNRMIKTGKPCDPFQVEIPLAFVLPDKVVAELEKIRTKEDDARQQSVASIRPAFSFWDHTGRALGGTLRVASEFLPSRFRFTERVLEKLADRAEKGAKEKMELANRSMEDRRRELQESLANVVDEATALEHALDRFRVMSTEFEFHFPASRIELPQ